MQFKIILILFFISILINENAFAQKKPAKSDSTNIYKKIELYSSKHKFTKFMYPLFFKPIKVNPIAASSKKKEVKKKAHKNIIQNSNIAFEGKIIRHINIQTLDPFGYSITDTSVSSKNYMFKKANKMHIKSLRITIRNLLLIRENQIFDSLLFKESERLVRSRGYVRDVSFSVVSTSKKSDSVDVFIREIDKWSLIPQAILTNSKIMVQLNDNNFLGLGHESKNNFIWYPKIGGTAYNATYIIPNIINSYANTTLHYNTDEFRNFNKSFSIDRPFYSQFTKWAAGVNFSQQFYKDSIYLNDSVFVFQKFKFNSQDYWVGNAIQIFKGNSENNRTTNFISTVRYLKIRYIEKPIEIFDTLHVFSNEDFYFASIGISTRKYVQDKFIFKYGLKEDVAIGKVYSITGGYQIKNNIGRFYLGARASIGNYYSWGYFSSNFEYGTFFRSSHAEQGVFKASINYFTKLFEVGKWKFRQFAKPQITIGINRLPSETITINDGFGIDGFNSVELLGTSKMLFTFQTQSYAPWNLIGFRFGPYLIFSLGMLGNSKTGFKNSRVYSQIGLGVLIINDNLVLNTFKISIAFYPLIPGIGQNVFKMNSFKTADFGFRDFEIGKPSAIEYQ